MKTLDELDALYAAAWEGAWTSETWEVECDLDDTCPSGNDCEGSHDCDTILAPEAYPDGQVVAQTSHADGRIMAPGLEQFARANTAAIVALHNAWPEISARLRAAERLATYDHEIVKAAFVWSQAHDGIDGGLDDARQALFEAVERRRAAEGVEPVTTYRARPA